MRYRITPLLAVASALALVACGPGEETEFEPDTPAEDVEDVRETPMPDYTETLQSDFTATEHAESDIIGTLHLEEPTTVAPTGTPMRIRVQVSGLAEEDHPWDIHAGACGSEGEVIVPFGTTAGDEGISDPLSPDDQGIAEAEVEVPTLADQWMGPGDHSVHIHTDVGDEHGPTLACATL